jgi:hypothetical protein
VSVVIFVVFVPGEAVPRIACYSRSRRAAVRIRIAAFAVVLASASVLTASQEPKKSDKDNKEITVSGCAEAGYLRVHEVDGKGSYTERYKLAGSKSLLKEIASQQHGHLLEVTGRVVDAPGTEHTGHTTPVGKNTKIYIGTKDIPTIPAANDTPKLEVTSYRETQESCSGK